MGDITSSCTFSYGWSGDLKTIVIETPATAATGDTIDLGSDTAHARGVYMKSPKICYCAEDTGEVKVATFAVATGIITLGTITTGIHNLLIVGK